ncbi:hypothetical protein P389DRAFT_207210 [Cystobasidium minutum MCA 4210]|uniref:uncharacterized protein n=1 Tax=Cystobasidium minutum MCA 4210 TaxID=1397322 RepID=UPI0034CED81B|eukprot:jgi/Rhomi1/207210/estExt_Genemark1.C_1_t10077
MDSRSKGKAPVRASDAVQQLLEDLEKSGSSGNGALLANLRSLHGELKQKPTRASTSQQPKTRIPTESPSAAQLRIAHEEAKARRLAAEAEKARAEAALKSYRASPSAKPAPKASNDIKSKTPSGTSTPRTLSPAERRPKPSKMTSLMHILFMGLNVQARPWEAPTSDLLALQQARRSIGGYQFNQQRKTKEMTALLDEVRAIGGNEADALQILLDMVDRKISKEEAEKKMEALKSDKKKDDKGLSIAEKEELARLEIRAQQLKLQKLQLQRREQERKEVEDIQKRIRDLSLPVRLTKPDAQLYDDHPLKGRLRDPMAFAGFDDLGGHGGHGGSPAFGEFGDDMFGPEDQLYDDDLDDMSMLDQAQHPKARQGGKSTSAHPLMIGAQKPAYETLGNTGLPKLNVPGRPPAARRAQTTPAAVNFRIQPNDPRLDPRSAYYNHQYAQAYRLQQQRDAQQLQLAKQAEEEKARKLALEKKAMAEEREQSLIDAQIYQERKLQEEARIRAAQQAREQDLLRKRNELDHVRSLEEIAQHQEELDYLEDLLTKNPHAMIPGLDMNRLQTDPNALRYVLELVEENIRKPEAIRRSADVLEQALQGDREAAKKRKDIARQERELNRLEALLTQHPQATIKGLDLQQIQTDPDILAKALRQVEEFISRGENPIEIPLRTSVGERLNEARTTRQLSAAEQRLADKFLMATPALQLTHLNSLPSASLRQRFLESAMLQADFAQAQDLVERYRPYGFNLVIPSDAAARIRTPQPAAAPEVPTIVVEATKSPPPTQDNAPSFPFPDMTTGNIPLSSPSAWQGEEKEGLAGQTTALSTYVLAPSAGLPHLPSPPMNTPGRISAVHPSAAAAARAREADIERQKSQEAALARQKAYDEELAAEQAELAAAEAEIERERQELVEADEALRRAEEAKAIEEELRRTEEEAQALLDRQDEARARAAAELEEAAQIQARQMAEAEAAEHDAWGSLPPPPADFVAGSPIVAPLPTPPLPVAAPGDPWGSPLVQVNEEVANIENDPAWGEGTAELKGAPAAPESVKSASPAPSNFGTPKSEARSTRFSPKAASVAPITGHATSANEPAATAADAWPPSPTFAPTLKLRSGATSLVGSPAASLKAASVKAASVKAASVRSPSAKGASPLLAPVKTPSVKAFSPASAASKLSTPVITPVPASPAPSVRSEKLATPALVPESVSASPVVSEKASSPKSAKAATPTPSVHSTPKAATPATPKITTPAAPIKATPILPVSSSPLIASPAKSATPKVATPPTPKAATPKAATPVASAAAWKSPTAKVDSSAKTATPKVLSAWGSPAVSAKDVSSAKPSPVPAVADVWGSPAASVKAVSSAKPSPAPVIADAWGSPSVKGTPKKAAAVHSNQHVDVWGAASPAEATTPPAKSTPLAGAWGSPAAVPAASPKVASPAKSAASKASKGSKASLYKGNPMSPAFGITPGVPTDDGENMDNNFEGAGVAASEPGFVSTAIKGVDPVVVSMVEPPTPPPAAVSPLKTPAPGAGVAAATVPAHEDDELLPGEEYTDYSDEGEHDGGAYADDDFDPSTFPIYMAGEPIEPGFTVVMNPPPHVFQEEYPKQSAAVTIEAILDHMARLAHNHGYDAIYQCAYQEEPESIFVQGYMVHLEPTGAPSPSAGGPSDVPDKNAGKATVVSDASTPGWS